MSFPVDKIKLIVTELNTVGITDKKLQAGILSKIWTETRFIPKVETGYSKTPNAQIRKIFGSRVSSYSEDQLTKLKSSDEAFFNVVYAGLYGNCKNDGYKYRGRFFNQLTFKANYERYGKLIGIDISSAPDKFNSDVTVSAKIAAAYFKDRMNGIDLSPFNSLDGAALLMLRLNAGWGTDVTTTFYKDLLKEQTKVVRDLFALI